MIRRLLVALIAYGLLLGCSPDTLVPPEEQAFKLDQTIVNHLFGALRYLQTVNGDTIDIGNEMFLIDNEVVNCEIYAKDVVLGRDDSLRIGIIHPLERLYAYPQPRNLPDYLILGAYGQDSISIFLEQDNVGTISDRTFFRVDRNYYLLSSLDSSRQNIRVRSLERRPADLPVAELQSHLKKVPLTTERGLDTLIGHEAGRRELFYFFSLGVRDGSGLLETKEAIERSGTENVELIPVTHVDSPNNVAAFKEQYGYDGPVYSATSRTCENLLCQPNLPYGLLVNESGRVVSFNLRPRELEAVLEKP